MLQACTICKFRSYLLVLSVSRSLIGDFQMSARKIKRRISGLMYARLYGKSDRLSDELQLWERIAPIGREFGSPDFERLLEEEIKARTTKSSHTQ